MADGYIERFAMQMARTSGPAAPTTGTWGLGDLRWNDAPSSGEPLGWLCIAAGTPGTWVPVAQAQTATATAISAAGTISPADSVVDVATGGFNITLAAPTTAQIGAVTCIVNDSAGAVTLTPVAGVTLYAGSAVLATNTQAQVKVVGGNYYRI